MTIQPRTDPVIFVTVIPEGRTARRVDLSEKVLSLVYEDSEHKADKLVLSTIGASDATHGELPWRTEFGSLLHRLRHQKNDAVLQELARVYVVDALKRWEPRIVVTAVQIGREQQDGKSVLAIRFHYDFVSTNIAFNINQTLFV